ncbi:hypothetical protein [Achromobacter xylosoxidans]|uniref:hypothetical protein n=1 Tax=Alcaligenes xylosoxydans xylosoxydans TaxID=85698 RepID=UPI000B48B80F|nr:hypothetical protein [Achromobacter xylosoxidans]
MGAAHPQMKGGPLARLAGQLCQRADFQAFCEADGAEQAAEFVRVFCGVDSRAEIDHHGGASERFHDLRRQFAYRDAA